MKPAPDLLDALRGLRLAPNRANPSQGPGERRSAMRGAGLEFMDHRPYREGDDIRHLDARLLARFGQPFIRQFAADQKLPVIILLDTSPSMTAGTPPKSAIAYELAQQLGFIALASDDAVRLCRLKGMHPEWSPVFSGIQRADMLFSWVSASGAAAGTDTASYGRLLASALPTVPRESLVIMISDWLDADAADSLGLLGRSGHEPVVIHIAAPEEIDPASLGQGDTTIADLETGTEITITLDDATLKRYKTAFDQHRADLAAAARGAQGWYFFTASTEPAVRLVGDEARRAGLVA